MLTKSFALAAAITLAGTTVWAGCSGGSAVAPAVSNDAGDPNRGDGSNGQDDSGPGGRGDTPDSGDKKDSGDNNAPEVPIAYGTCPAFTKCGGEIVGSWKVSGGCLSSDTFAAAKDRCPGLTESDVVIKASGTVVATATTVERKTTVKLSAKVTLPKDGCGFLVPDCGLIGAGLKSGQLPGTPKFDDATCTDGGTECNCTVAATVTEDKLDTYTVADGVLTTANPTRTFDYCVQGNKTTYTETTPAQGNAFVLPIIVEITK
jgi:hypothetical protein